MSPTEDWHLAQANVAHMREPLDHPVMEGFRALLDPINALADATPGFVWRLQSGTGNATDIQAFEDPLILLNMSVWESVEALSSYTYRSQHSGPFRNRGQWFLPHSGLSLVLWWIPASHIPTVEEAKAKLQMLAQQGPSPEAFTFRAPFPRPAPLPSLPHATGTAV